jgi:hypothetical protein
MCFACSVLMPHCPDSGTRPGDRRASVLGLRCSWCPSSAPTPKLLGLYALAPANRQGAALPSVGAGSER